MTDRITAEASDGVLQVRINRPDKKNALTRDMYNGLSDALATAAADPSVKVIVLTGTGDSFTSGNDIADFLSSEVEPGEKPSLRFLRMLSDAEKPVVAAVNGMAVGIGVTLLLHCDLVYAADTATFQLPFVNLGLVPEAGSSLLLPRLVGHQRASELMLLGERFTAAVALELGFVNRVVPLGDFPGAVRDVTLSLASKPGRAVRMTKALLKGTRDELSQRIAEEAALFYGQLGSPEAAEAMAAFRERRKPDFSAFA